MSTPDAESTSPQASQGAPSPQDGASAPDSGADSHAAGEKRKSAWIKNFGSFTDNLAGVSLSEDRENHIMVIKFDQKPSDEVRAALKAEPYGFRFNPDTQAWYKRISPATPAQSRREAQDVAFEVANLIRGERGVELHTSFARNA